MEIRNRLFPYPVLCNETDDYQNNSFETEVKVEERLHDIYITVKFKLDNLAILDLIRMGMAEYVLHLECSMTYFRKVIKTDINEISYSIPKERVNGEIAVLSMVVAKRRIVSFTSEDLNEDYDGESISFDKASILAYQNMPKIQVFKNYEELAGNESLFAVVKVGLPDDEEVHCSSLSGTGKVIISLCSIAEKMCGGKVSPHGIYCCNAELSLALNHAKESIYLIISLTERMFWFIICLYLRLE